MTSIEPRRNRRGDILWEVRHRAGIETFLTEAAAIAFCAVTVVTRTEDDLTKDKFTKYPTPTR